MRGGWLAAAAAGVLVLGALAVLALVPRHAGGSAAVTIGGPFDLVDGNGARRTEADFRGRFMLVYFGYTHCPDACPTMLSDMAAAIDALPADRRARLVPLFITVDPARDIPAMIGEYVQAFGPEFVGLTGSAEAVAKAERSYHVYAVRHPLKNGDYAMDHSSVLYVMGPDGRFRGVIEDNTKPAIMAQALENFGV